MIQGWRQRLVAGAVLAGLLSAASPARAQGDERKRLDESLDVLSTLVSTPDDSIPQYILERAEAIVIIPSLVKGGFVLGAEHGKGVLSVRNRATNSWSAPTFVVLTGGSLGWQIGLQSVDLVLLVMNPNGVDKLLSSEFKLGANASVAAGPVGRTAQAATDVKLDAEILAYSRAKGLFAGATIEGASFKDDEKANKAFYGAALQPKAIFAEQFPKDRAAKLVAFRDGLKRLIAVAK